MEETTPGMRKQSTDGKEAGRSECDEDDEDGRTEGVNLMAVLPAAWCQALVAYSKVRCACLPGVMLAAGLSFGCE